MNIPRMRTVPEAAAELKALDEHTSLTQCAIRRLVLEGRIKSIKAGRKHLINFDQLLEYLVNPLPEGLSEEAPISTTHIVVRQIKSTTIRHFILTGIAEKRSNKAYYKHLIRQIK